MAENRELALVLKLVADQFQSELKKSGGALQDFTSFIKDWKTQIVAGAAALFAIAKSTANYGEELLKTSQKIGIEVSELSKLQHAANMADLGVDQLTAGLKFLSVNMAEAERKTGDGETLLRRIGVTATDSAGKLRPIKDVLLEVAQGFRESNDGAGKAELAVKLFGKAGLDLIPFLNRGAAGIKELMEEAERLGVVMSEKDAQAADEFNDELKRLHAQLRGITFAIGKELIPVIKEMMKLFREVGVGPAFSLGMEYLHRRFVGLNALVKELTANYQFLKSLNPFGDAKDNMTLDELRKQIDAIEAEAKRKVFEFKHPGVLTPELGAPGAAGTKEDKGKGDAGKRNLSAGEEQERLGKKIVENALAYNRAVEIHNKLAREGAEGESEFFLAYDRAEQRKQEDREEQEKHARRIIAETQLEIKIRDEGAARERANLVTNAQAWIAYHEKIGSSAKTIRAKQLELIEAQLAQELQMTEAQAAELLAAWTRHEDEKAAMILSKTQLTLSEQQTLQMQTLTKVEAANQAASDDVIDGWKKGMRDYVKQVGNGFNLGTDMARRTAQAMEQGFSNFFFDVMDGKINNFKDALRSMADFAKRLIAQIAAQLATSAILKLFTVATAGPAAPALIAGQALTSTVASPGASSYTVAKEGGMLARRFAVGGVVFGDGNQDTVPALLTPGEVVLSRRDVHDIKDSYRKAPAPPLVMAGATGEKKETTVIVNNYGRDEVKTSSETSPTGGQLVYITIREAVRKGIANGDMDKALGGRFRLSPRGGA